LDQLERLITAVEAEDQKRSSSKKSRRKNKISNNRKLLTAINRIAFEQIPQDPTLGKYRQGSTLGPSFRHWFREKFGNGRFRLFFRFDSQSKVIVYAWVNDERTKRTYGSSADAYAVFSKMLQEGNPPDTWSDLVKSCTSPTVLHRLANLLKKK
jgi:toxin YhaV